MKKRSIYLGALVMTFIGIGIALWFWPKIEKAPGPRATAVAAVPRSLPLSAQSSPPTHASSVSAINIPNFPGHPLSIQDKQNIGQILAVFSAPISFWGKVIDQESKQPVPGVNVLYGAADRYFGKGTDYHGSSDENGLFSITGIGGAGLYVEVSKEGYYRIPDKSYHGFANGSSDMPSRDNPAIFELRKRGQTESLIVKGIGHQIARDGTPIQINLTTGQIYGVTDGDIQVQAWTNDASVPVNSGLHYDWRCKITVSGGGMQSRIGLFNFEAPTDGYQPSDEIDMPANSEQWRQQAQRSYFVRLANGDYARIDFQMIAGGDHFFTITSYLNPTPGHRNLEYDPNQRLP